MPLQILMLQFLKKLTLPMLPQNLSQCGDFTFSQVFDLTVNDAEYLGFDNPQDILINYFKTEQAAIEGTTPINNPENL